MVAMKSVATIAATNLTNWRSLDFTALLGRRSYSLGCHALGMRLRIASDGRRIYRAAAWCCCPGTGASSISLRVAVVFSTLSLLEELGVFVAHLGVSPTRSFRIAGLTKVCDPLA
jgi:hypothetical protein